MHGGIMTALDRRCTVCIAPGVYGQFGRQMGMMNFQQQ